MRKEERKGKVREEKRSNKRKRKALIASVLLKQCAEVYEQYTKNEKFY